MRLKDDHMRNAQLKPAYNIQAAVCVGYGVGVVAFAQANDLYTLKPFVDYLREVGELTLQRIVADARYESEESYVYLFDEGLETYIKLKNYEQSQKRNHHKKIKLRENMTYNDLEDYYKCANGRKFILTGTVIE